MYISSPDAVLAEARTQRAMRSLRAPHSSLLHAASAAAAAHIFPACSRVTAWPWRNIRREMVGGGVRTVIVSIRRQSAIPRLDVWRLVSNRRHLVVCINPSSKSSMFSSLPVFKNIFYSCSSVYFTFSIIAVPLL